MMFHLGDNIFHSFQPSTAHHWKHSFHSITHRFHFSPLHRRWNLQPMTIRHQFNNRWWMWPNTMLFRRKSSLLSIRNRRWSLSLNIWRNRLRFSLSKGWPPRSSGTWTITERNRSSECLRFSERSWASTRIKREWTSEESSNHWFVKRIRREKIRRLFFSFIDLACGGDGTVGWVLSALDTSQMQYMDFVSVGVIPLGTGNDMARFLGWGVGYRGEPLTPIVQSLAKSETRLLDRWQIDVKPTAHTGIASLKVKITIDRSSNVKHENGMEFFRFHNLFSTIISVLAPMPKWERTHGRSIDRMVPIHPFQIALDFHEKRNASPRRYANRLFNKLAYGCISW